MLAAVACTDSTRPPRPTAIVLVGTAPVAAQVGTAVTGLAVVVNDEKGNAMSGQPLSVSVTAGGGADVSAPSATIAGSTAVGVWTLGNKTGANTITISSGALTPVVVTVQGTAGPASKVASTVSVSVGTVGATVATGFLVSDQFDNASPSSTVTLATTGGGSVASASVTSDANGRIAPAWTLGTIRGTNTLTASLGASSAVLSMIAQSDVPAAMQVAGGVQSANAGTALASPPGVIIVDRFGNGVPGRAVSFSLTAGGGSVSGASTATTDTNGVAAGPTWTLGKRNIAQQLTATAGSITQVISAKVNAISIVLRFFGTMTDAQKAVFQGAADRVSAMITKGAGPVQADSFPIATECGVTGAAPITELIDGVIIYASIGPIDGSGNILAEAGPCGIRDASAKYQPAIALMLFDISDLALLAGGGSLEDVATHEMMHSLGFGTLWQAVPLVNGLAGSDPRYFGGGGITGCRNIGGAATCAATVPVENTGGSGTAGQHWRESVFSNELMTGYINTGANPISAMSIASMTDFGYTVNTVVADVYSIASAIRALPGAQLLPGTWERLRVMPAAPALLERSGNLLRVRANP